MINLCDLTIRCSRSSWLGRLLVMALGCGSGGANDVSNRADEIKDNRRISNFKTYELQHRYRS